MPPFRGEGGLIEEQSNLANFMRDEGEFPDRRAVDRGVAQSRIGECGDRVSHCELISESVGQGGFEDFLVIHASILPRPSRMMQGQFMLDIMSGSW